MKKNLLLLLIIFMLTGCSVIKIDNKTNNYKNIINAAVKSNTQVNRASTGYKYFLPKGMTLVSDNDFNQVIKAYNTNIYLYVDVVSYYYNSKLSNIDNNDYYFYQKITNDKKNGYVYIDEKGGNYFIKIVYNYAKIEAYATKENLSEVLAMSSNIVGSIEYNKKMIKILLEDKSVSSSEITYKLDKPNDSESNFSLYLKEYAKEEETDKLPDLE